MKKLSFILAIIMILTCMPIIATTSVSAADPIVDLEAPGGQWKSVSKEIGFVLDNGKEIKVDTLTYAADIARENSGTQVVLYLKDNYKTEKRIGIKDINDAFSYDTIDLSEDGADLVIDGTGHSMYSSDVRFIHFGNSQKTNGKMTFRNMTIGTTSTAQGSMQTNEGSLGKITFENVTIDIPNPRGSTSNVMRTNVEFNGVTRDCKGEDFIYTDVNNISFTIKNSTITNAQNIINGHGYSFKDIMIDGLNIKSTAGDVLWNGKCDNLTINNLDVTDGLDYLIAQVNAKQVDINCSKSIAYKNDAIGSLTAEKLNVYNLSVASATNVISNCTIDKINIYNLNVTSCENVISNCTIDKINIYDLNVTSCDRLSDNLSGDITIHNANVTSKRANSNKFNGNMVINGGTYTTSEDSVIYFGYSGEPKGSTLTINGGTFTTKSSGHKTIHQAFSGANKVLTINGGTFNSWNKSSSVLNNTAFEKYKLKDDGKTVAYEFLEKNGVGVLYTTADTFYVNGGTFNLYADDGKTLASGEIGANVSSRGGGYIALNGGTFNGGQYVYFRQNGQVTFGNCTKLAMPQGNTYKIANSLTTTKGASVRTSSTETDTGIRFQGTVTKDVVDYVKAISGSANVYYGIAILPADYVEDAYGIFSLSEISSANFGKATKQKSANSVTGSLTFTLALTGIKNVDRKFVARTYVYGDLNGNGIIEFSDIVVYGSECSYARSAKETAQAALADVMMVSGTYGGRKYNTATTAFCLRTDSGGFINITEDTKKDNGDGYGTRYSAFTTDQIAVLKKYAGIA